MVGKLKSKARYLGAVVGVVCSGFLFTGSSSATTMSDTTINWNEVHQRIDGFGAAAAWTAPNISNTLADTFFSADKGVGLSLVRLRIAPDGTTLETTTAQRAIARGATVWASAWSPPAAWKTNNDTKNGGSLLPSHYQDWANTLVNFVKNMQTNGVPIYALSFQNEPNVTGTYETCIWTPQDMETFVRDYLGPTFARNGLTTKLIIPEPSRWDKLTTYADPILNDAVASPFISIVASHEYAGAPFWYTLAKNQGKTIWQSEVSDFAALDTSIGSGVKYAKQINDDLTIAEVNAWNYWWLIDTKGDNEGLTENGNPTKRLYAEGNFAKFVRPGYYRIGTTNNPVPGVYVTAFKDLTSGAFAIVAINTNSSKTNVSFGLNGFSASQVTPWVTSNNLNLASKGSVAVTGGQFSYGLNANSVITFSGTNGQ